MTLSSLRRLLAIPLVALTVVLPLAGCGSAQPPQPAPAQHQPSGGSLAQEDVDDWLDGVLPTALQTTGIPGASVVVVADGEILTARGYGMADTGTDGAPPTPVDPDKTLFRVGSVSKAVTATAVMQLVEEGTLDLDADVQQYLDFDLPTPRGEVTLRHLLSHTAGFEERVRGLITAETGASLRDAVAVDPPQQVFAPGTVPAYSNYGNALAGYIVERVNGQPFAEAIETSIFDRAGMDSSSFEQPLPEDLADRLARGYPDDSKAPLPVEYVSAAPAGAMSSTATDMGRFMLAHLGALPEDRSLLSPESLELMHAPALDEQQLGTLAEGRRMSLGLFDEERSGLSALGHGGDTQVFHTEMRIYPQDDAGIFVALNGSGRDALDSHELRAALAEGFADRYIAADESAAGDEADDAPVDPAGTTERAAAAVGTYETARTPFSTFGSILRLNGQTAVTPGEDGTLILTPGPASAAPAVYEEVRPWAWREVGGEDILSMRAEDGAVTAISWGSAFTLLRAEPAHRADLAVPVLLGSVLVLIIAAVAWPSRAIIRRRLGSPAVAGRGRAVRILTQTGVGLALAATAGWAATIMTLMSYQDVPDSVLRILQGGQVLGALAIIPGLVHLVDAVRFRQGALAVLARAAVVAAMAGVAWFALAFHLIAPSVSY